MTELEQLRADLATLEKASNIAARDHGYSPIFLEELIRQRRAKIAGLENELRCERIDGGKVRDDRKAVDAERNREKLAELTTILNAIPPACELARELVEKRIEQVKKEIHRPEEQGNG